MTNQPTRQPTQDDIAVDVAIVHGTPGPDLLHALQTTGYRPVGTTTRHTIYARTHQPVAAPNAPGDSK